MIALAAPALGLLAAATSVAGAAPDAAAVADTAFRTCEAWLLEPGTWAEGVDGFVDKAGLDGSVEAVATVPEFAMPPAPFRQALHHFRVPVGEGGILVTTSDIVPICHVVGGGPRDLQPGTVATLASEAFGSRWRRQRTERREGMFSTTWVSRVDPRLTMIVSHAAEPGGREDRAQLIATAQYQIGN